MKKQTAENLLKNIQTDKKAMEKLKSLQKQLQTKVKEDKKQAKKRIRYEDALEASLLRQGFCEICGAPADEVHHIVEVHQQVKWNCRVRYANLVPLCTMHHQMVHNQDELYLRKGKYQKTVWPKNCLRAIKLWLLQEITKQTSLEEALSLKAKLNILRGATSLDTPQELTFPLIIKRAKECYLVRNPKAMATNIATGKKVKTHCFISGGKFFSFIEGEKYFDVAYDPHLVVDEWITEKPLS